MRQLNEAELADLVADYDRDGFAYVRSMFSVEELAPLADRLDPEGAAPGGFSVTDSEGGRQELSVWLELGDDLVGVIPRLAPLVDIAAAVIGGQVYHWHSKLSWKRPHTGSLWDWHQDYAFWVNDGVADPDMCTIAIAVGRVEEANGCMRLITGSHHLGTINVVDIGPSQGADPDAVATALESHAVELCELDPGDVVVFHSNTLHGSGPNQSDAPRTMLMSSYNAVSNPPTEPRNAGYLPDEMSVLSAQAIAQGWTEVFGATAFIDPDRDGMDQGYSVESVASPGAGWRPHRNGDLQ